MYADGIILRNLNGHDVSIEQLLDPTQIWRMGDAPAASKTGQAGKVPK